MCNYTDSMDYLCTLVRSGHIQNLGQLQQLFRELSRRWHPDSMQSLPDSPTRPLPDSGGFQYHDLAALVEDRNRARELLAPGGPKAGTQADAGRVAERNPAGTRAANRAQAKEPESLVPLLGRWFAKGYPFASWKGSPEGRRLNSDIFDRIARASEHSLLSAWKALTEEHTYTQIPDMNTSPLQRSFILGMENLLAAADVSIYPIGSIPQDPRRTRMRHIKLAKDFLDESRTRMLRDDVRWLNLYPLTAALPSFLLPGQFHAVDAAQELYRSASRLRQDAGAEGWLDSSLGMSHPVPGSADERRLQEKLRLSLRKLEIAGAQFAFLALWYPESPWSDDAGIKAAECRRRITRLKTGNF